MLENEQVRMDEKAYRFLTYYSLVCFQSMRYRLGVSQHRIEFVVKRGAARLFSCQIKSECLY